MKSTSSRQFCICLIGWCLVLHSWRLKVSSPKFISFLDIPKFFRHAAANKNIAGKLFFESFQPLDRSWVSFLRGSLHFPTCQVRVVRFYQSCSSSPPPPPSSSFSSSASSSSSTTPASTYTSTVALPTLGQALRQLRSSVRTAGPQPDTSPAQCTPLDLNLGPS